ncbi:DUF2971 domain-containing protein [Desulfosporosinus sp. SB140]|uniref:DUF2971 domain-containing protein n=1 Tax=Desulfosporosinus paludis TaxID=3115649 RepID=UPI00388F7246
MESSKSCYEPKKLYHYTTSQAFISILEHKKIWVTNYRFLNDYKELILAIKLAHTHSKFDDSYKASLDFLEREPFNLAIFSLSQDKDLLSQWRSYCPGGGYAIGFDFHKLEKILRKRGFTGLKRCIYDEKEQLKIIDNFAENLPLSPVSSSGSEHLIINIHKFLQEVGLLIKHNSFQEENEWRAISNNKSPIFNSTNESKWKVREKDKRLIPFLEVDLKDEADFPICEIVIGPCRDQELAKQAVEVALKAYEIEMPKDALSLSNIPYRNY